MFATLIEEAKRPQAPSLFDLENLTVVRKDGDVVIDAKGRQWQYASFPELTNQ